MKKLLAVTFLALLTAPMFAGVQLETSINDVFYRGTNELAGSITMRVNSNDFNDTSTSDPVFIRVTLDRQARLSRTLVDTSLPSTDFRSNPIFLAMTLTIPQGTSGTLQADERTTSIVRWVEGESEFWVRVQTDSSDWILLGASTLSPDTTSTVSWTVGISARNSFELQEGIASSQKNLPFNTRNPDDYDNFATAPVVPDTDDATSTLICVDLSDSNLTNDGTDNAILQYDIIAFDATADLGGGQYTRGNDTGINFTNDFRIARGKDRSCSVTPFKPAPLSQDLCVPAAAQNSSVDGWLSITNSITFVISCARGGDFLQTDLLDGAYFEFDTGNRGNFGFDNSGTDAGVYSLSGLSSSSTAISSFTNNGRTLYRTIRLTYAGGTPITLSNTAVTANVTVFYYFTEPPVTVDLDYRIVLVNHDGALDSAPFNGADQHRRCPPSEFQIAADVWNFGSFTACTGTPAVLFFPYLPKLKGDALFWSGLSVVNQGAVDFVDGLIVHLYDENGNLFVANFPALPVRNQYTWLLVDDPESGQTGFFGMGAYDGTVIVPSPADPSVPAESFGETRFSMFVVGTFEAEFSGEQNLGDLDGYLLIGKDGDIDGSYLPRNIDDTLANQDGDLPIQRAKSN